jgi:hypothetical protein
MSELQGLGVHTVSFVDRAAVRDPQETSEPQQFLLWKREGAHQQKGDDHMPPVTKSAEELAAELQQAEDNLAKKGEEAESLKAELEQARKAAAAGEGSEGGQGEEDDDGDDMKKGELPEAVQAALAKADERASAAEERASKAEELAKGEQRKRVEGEYVAKAETEFSHIAKAQELGPVLMNIAERVGKDESDYLQRILRSADEALSRSALYSELGGSGGPGSAGAEDAFSEAQRKAEELRKADVTLTPEQALQKAMEGDPELAERYAREVR